MGRVAIDLTGNVYGLLTVIERAKNFGAGTGWLCACQCGETITRSGTALRWSGTLSCGCLRRKKLIDRNRAGMKVNSKGANYQQWRTMVRRCHDEGHISYKDYGAKGVKVCERWRFSYENFAQDMGPRPKGLTIDRKDNSLGYTPENCRWATYKQQAENKSNVSLVDVNGVQMTYPDACKHYGISYGAFKNRTNTLGWSVDAALKTPLVSMSDNYSRRGLPKP